MADRVSDCFDDFAGETTHAVGRSFFFGGNGDGDVFEEDGDSLNGFGAEGALSCGELEGIRDFVGEGVWGYCAVG